MDCLLILIIRRGLVANFDYSLGIVANFYCSAGIVPQTVLALRGSGALT